MYRRCVVDGRRSLFQAGGDVLGDAYGVGDDGEGGVHGSDGGHEAAVDYVEVVEVVCFAVYVQGGGVGVGAESDGACLVGGCGDVHRFVEVEAAFEGGRVELEVAEHGVEDLP